MQGRERSPAFWQGEYLERRRWPAATREYPSEWVLHSTSHLFHHSAYCKALANRRQPPPITDHCLLSTSLTDTKPPARTNSAAYPHPHSGAAPPIGSSPQGT